MKQRSGSSSLSALKLKSFSSLVKWCMAHYTRHMNVTCLYGIFTGCVWMHAQIPDNHWQCEWTKIRPFRDKSRDTFSVYFPEWLCEGAFVSSQSFYFTSSFLIFHAFPLFLFFLISSCFSLSSCLFLSHFLSLLILLVYSILQFSLSLFWSF